MKRKRPLVVLETPFAAFGDRSVADNIRYAKLCLIDTLVRGEAAIASHLLWTHEGLLSDDVPLQRWAGIAAGVAWYEVADLAVVYNDHGVTPGMQSGIDVAQRHGVPVLYRQLPPVLLSEEDKIASLWWDTHFNGWFDRSYPADLKPASGGVVKPGRYRIGEGQPDWLSLGLLPPSLGDD